MVIQCYSSQCRNVSFQAACFAGFLLGLGLAAGGSPDSTSDRSSLRNVSSDLQLVQLTLLVSRLPWTVRMSPAPHSSECFVSRS